MKLTALTAGLMACFSFASALVSLSYIPTEDGRIRIGDSIRVKWTTDGTCDLSLHLNKIENEKWSTVDTAFENLRQQAGDGEYLFEIPKVKENKVYAFTLNATKIDGTGDAEGDKTENFMINKKGYKEKRHARDISV
ncbi:hypothetical protein E4T52_14366 [Aureobasidium sp. EXF-3400]|nr:hypothetical protein E4T51_13356 [Aureobasidium sp. EXF-12344]KAI4770626.1 hypothetical protein E4T52_14366 [Aureobasidium sp. EXF-3400]